MKRGERAIAAGPCLKEIHHPFSVAGGVKLDVSVSPDGKSVEMTSQTTEGKIRQVKVNITGGDLIDFAAPSVCGKALYFLFVSGAEAVISTLTGQRWQGTMPQFVI